MYKTDMQIWMEERNALKWSDDDECDTSSRLWGHYWVNS